MRDCSGGSSNQDCTCRFMPAMVVWRGFGLPLGRGHGGHLECCVILESVLHLENDG